MEQIFKTFLQEQGVYEMFTKFVLKHFNCSLQHYCREHRISEYCLELNRSPLLTGSEAIALNKLWKQRWRENKQKILYDFIVHEGCLFQFIEDLEKGKTLESICQHPHNINDVFWAHIRPKSRDTAIWNKMHKKWRKHLREKVFTFN